MTDDYTATSICKYCEYFYDNHEHTKLWCGKKGYGVLSDAYSCPDFKPDKEKLENSQKKEQDSLEIISVKEAIERGVPEIKYIIDPFLRQGGITIIGGEPASKKSLLAMLMCVCVVKGEKLFNRFETKQKRVMYLDFENGYAVLVNRFHSLLFGNFAGNKENTEHIFLSVFNDIKLDDSKRAIPILNELDERYKPDVFICDSLVRCMEGDEDRSSDVRRVFDNLKEFLAKDKSFIILHHTRKGDSKGMNALRGSSDLGGMAEIVLMLKASNDFTHVEIAKHRHIGIDSSSKWGFMIDKECFGEDSKFLKLKYFENDPNDQDAISQCYDDLEALLQDNYKTYDKVRSKGLWEAMDKIGHKKWAFSEALKKIQTNEILRFGGKKGLWEVT